MKDDNKNCDIFAMSYEERDQFMKDYFKKVLADIHSKGISTTHSDGEYIYTLDASGEKKIIGKDSYNNEK